MVALAEAQKCCALLLATLLFSQFEFDAAILAHRDITGQSDDRVGQADFWAAERLVIGIGIPDAPGPVLDLFGVPAADRSGGCLAQRGRRSWRCAPASWWSSCWSPVPRPNNAIAC